MGLEPFRTSAGVVDRSDRGKLVFKGDQAHWFLDQLVTNRVELLEAGGGTEALMLTPKGRITAVMRLISTGKSVHADFDVGLAKELREFFEGRIFTTKVEITDRTEDFAILSVLGPRSDEICRAALERFARGESEEDRALGASLPGEDEHHTVHFGSVAAVRITRPIRGIDLFVRSESAAELVAILEDAGASSASQTEYAELCAVEGLPRFGVDFDGGYLPQEAAMERVVHFAKGCYLGQEAVAMAQRGRVKRRLRHLEFRGDPVLGDLVTDDTEAGLVSSIGKENDRGWGIVTVKTSVVPGSELRVVSEEGVEAKATIRELPGTTEGPTVPSGRELRERLQKG